MKEVVATVVASHGYGQRRAEEPKVPAMRSIDGRALEGCPLSRQHRSTQRKPSRRDRRPEVRQRMRDIAATRVRHGDRHIHVLLRREGWTVGRNVVWRLYREDGLALRSKRPRRRRRVVQREARCRPTRPNEAWSLDVIHDRLGDATRFRALTVVDVFSREGLTIEVGQRLRAERGVEVLNRLVRQHGAPACLFAVQRVGVHRPPGGPVGLSVRGPDRRLAAREADGQRVRRDARRLLARRVPEPARVRDDGRGQARHRGLAARHQREPAL